MVYDKDRAEQQRKASEQAKSEGNNLFQKAKYAAAIEKYTEAITMCPDWPIPYVNRALCHKKRSDWRQVIDDCTRALELDKEQMKAHYLLGVALREEQQLQRAIVHLVKALEAARQQNDNIKDEIWHELAKAKYAQWQVESNKRKEEHRLLKQRLLELLELQRKHEPQTSPSAAAQQKNMDEWAAWERLFLVASRDDLPVEPPSAYTCPLTMEVFRDPAITPSGQSYERAALLEHLAKVGHFDPVTRARVVEADLVQNVGLRAATQQYLDEHPWAWKECM